MQKPEWMLGLSAEYVLVGWVGDWAVIVLRKRPSRNDRGWAFAGHPRRSWMCILGNIVDKPEDFANVSGYTEIFEPARAIARAFDPTPHLREED